MKGKNSVTIVFQPNDFYNLFQEEMMLNKLASLPDVETYIKEAALHRASIEQQSNSDSYKKLMKIIYTHGADKIINMFEGDTSPSLQEEDVERIVYNILKKYTISPQIVAKETDFPMNEENGSEETKRKPSSKLKKL